MIEQELLQDLTESYLKSLISEVSGRLSRDFDASAPFGELGIDSFYVLKIIRRLEADFGTLPKSLLFENFNVSDLANYFVSKHSQVLAAKFADKLQGSASVHHTNGWQATEVNVREEKKPSASNGIDAAATGAAPIHILEGEAYAHPELRELVQGLFERYKIEGSVSRGTRKIAPNLFIGSTRRGYFHYGKSRNIILVYGYTGPRDYVPALLEEMYQYCTARNFQINILADQEITSIGSTTFSSTPFGVLQRILNLKEFALNGGEMRRLRYQVSKFEKSGTCKTEEYRCGSNPETDRNIAGIVDKWCATRAMVNPLVHEFKSEVLAGTLNPTHRLFLTYVNDVLQNVILITPMCQEENGYLMDLEFYPPEMPLGGLEFTITEIIKVLVAEGCGMLSLGGTYGCKSSLSAHPDPEVDKILDDLRQQNIFNDAGNLQFKNKFRPETKTIFLCRPTGSGHPDNVIDIIMMIADPEKVQTPDEENFNTATELHAGEQPAKETKVRAPSAGLSSISGRSVIEENDRADVLTKFGFNPLNIPHGHVEFDLKTDSWAQLHMPVIETQMRHLHAQLQQPASVDENLRAAFPFAHFLLTASGQMAEHIFFKAWPKKGIVLHNLLFPSTIFHQIDKGFTNRELPHPAVFDLESDEKYKGNLDWDALQAQLVQDSGAIALVCIEVGNNAAGGHPVSMQHLKNVKALLAAHFIPLVIDGTRVVENAEFLIEHEKECAGKSVWTVAREILSCADAVIGSLTKDFCVNKGGIIATNDARLFHRVQEIAHEEGSGTDLIDEKIIALSLENRKQIESRVLRRMEGVRLIWRELKKHNIPVVHPAGGHCILIDVKQVPEFTSFKYPVASFLAWLYLNTGIRAAAHSVGMQKHTRLNDTIRLAIPVGLKPDEISIVADRLAHAFERKINIPEVVMESSLPQPSGGIYVTYKLIKYHSTSKNFLGTEAEPIMAVSEAKASGGASSALALSPGSQESAKGSSELQTVISGNVSQQPGSIQVTADRKPRRIQDIAIIGMAGRYPKAKNVRELWENLAQGRDCIEEIPADRYAWRMQHGSARKYRGGFIDDVDRFDSLFFNISPREAEMVDPQERLFLEVAWEAIEDAGYYPEILAQEGGSRNIGVFVGAVWAMYQMLGVEERHAGNLTVPNSFLWSIANRVSHCFNLSGPSMTVDTACSSSLTALYLACEAIYAGECSAAIVGGVNLDLHQAKTDINQAGGALSDDGVCRSFGKGANGYVQGEGVGALFLKPLERAVQDGDNIYGVIKSAVVNHGGRTSGYTVPNPKAQTSLISSALERANIGAHSIGYIEAHGTGTELGDPIEITGLGNAFSRDNVANQTCAIGSLKSNIGHLEAAAGVAGISKVLLQMKQRQLAPSLHSAELNEFIDFQNSPFYVVQHPEEWKPKEVNGLRFPLRAGISSFGAGGANAHIILENYEPPRSADQQPSQSCPLIFPLSARNEDQLHEAAARLSTFLQHNPLDLNDVSYTLQVGRKSFEHRLAIIARTKEELLEKLASFIARKKAEEIVVGHTKSAEGFTRLLNRKEKEEFTRLLCQSRDPHKLAELWVEGLLTDWQGLQTQISGKRISLPTYAFADKRLWAYQRSSVCRSLHTGASMHPMVDTNESTFDRQLFKKAFSERDFFIYDHHVANIPTLPGVAYLEFARKAGEMAAGRRVQKIRNIVWVSPISVQNWTPKEVFIELKPSEATVRFEVFSNDEKGNKVPHSQGLLLYTSMQEAAAEPEYIDLKSIRARCEKVIDGKDTYPKFKSFGLTLGPSFQVVQEVYKSENEILGILKLPEFRQPDLQSMVLHPSLVDGSLQAGVSAHLGGTTGEMLVPFSIGEVEILHPLQPDCFSYITEAKEAKKEGSKVRKSNIFIVDETGKVLVKIRESVGVPLRELYDKPAQDAGMDGFSRLYYSYEWEKAPLGMEAAEEHIPSGLVLFDTEETLRDGYQERLRRAGKKADQVILVRPGESFQDLGKSYTINPQNKDDFIQLVAVLIEKQCSVENICFAWPAGHVDLHDEKCLKESLERGVYPFLFLCQALIKNKLDTKAQLLYLYSAKPGEGHSQNDAMRGFINTLHLEHPKLICKTVEIRQENAGCEQDLEALVAELQARIQDATAVRHEGQERFIKKLKAFGPEEMADTSSSQDPVVRERGVYHITGGAGGLGLIFAEFLAKEYKARLVLTGRSQLPADKEAKFDEFRKSGAEVLYLSADVSNYEDVRNVVNETRARFGEINGVIHAAGVLRDSLIRNKKPEEMSAVFAPKVYGTLYLDELTTNDKLDFFVTFSSLAAVAGNGGQCDYSFANHFMDSFAAERELLRARGARSGKTLSLNWSIWADGAMKLDEQTELYFKKTLGIKPLSKKTGLEAFVKGIVSEKSHFVVLEGVQEKVELAWGLRKKEPAPVSPSSMQPAAAPASGGGEDLRAWLQKELSQIVMEFLKLDPSDMATDKILLDLGFDSIGLTTYANTINEKFQLDITPVLFFDYPTVEEIARYLSVERESEIRQFYPGSANGAPGATPAPSALSKTKAESAVTHREMALEIKKGWNPAVLDRGAVQQIAGGGFSPETRFVNTPIAIVGMAGVMPQSEDLEEFWENLKNSKDMISIIPPDRWRWENYYGDPFKEVNKSNSKWGGFMKEIDKFDPLFFGISPREAQTMDPQQRIFLQTVWEAIEDSGQRVSDLSGTRTGLFVGVATNDYIDVMNRLQVALDGYSASGNSHSVLANRVSFLLNLRGPSAPLDTACSSSLVALHRAIESIHTGSCDMAIVGGVQVMLSPAAYISFSMAGMLSGDGKCKAFDKRANGYVRGEGCGAVFLKRLSAAEADGNHIYAVIRATAENHGGRVTTLTAPNSSAQSTLLIEAYEKAQIDPTTIGYIECHGTGTSLGDPIEIQALSKAFAELYKKRNKPPAKTPHCGLSSVKTNIGHLETAAGIASLLKVLLAIQHKHIPANIHFEEINPYINLNGTPFYIADKLTPWEAPRGEDGAPVPRRAGVSSFGFGGANAHIVLEEYLPPKRQPLPEAHGPQLIVLSAKNEDRLKAYVQSMQAYLEKAEVEPIDVAYTLQVGRDEMPERLALVVSSIRDLRQKFDQILKGERPEDSYWNTVKSKEAKSQSPAGELEIIRNLVEEKKLSRLAELWVSGTKIDWRLLYKSGVPRRIPVPTYPFARERYWIPEAEKAVQAERTDILEPKHDSRMAVAFLHPLIHCNVSTLQEQKFVSRFSGQEFYLADHVVETEKILPGVAYLEMARAAGELSGNAKVCAIRNVVWERPLIVEGDNHEVEVSLTPVKDEIRFSVKTIGRGSPIVHCTGKLAYSLETSAPQILDIAVIQHRCSEEVISGKDLYPLLHGSGLKLGRSFQIVQRIYANESESLAVLQLPEHLQQEAGQFWLHPALMDGSLHTAIGLMKKNGMDLPLSIPFSAGEVQIFHPLKDLRYGYATWTAGTPKNNGNRKADFHLLDKNGKVLARIKDFLSRPVHSAAMKTVPAKADQSKTVVGSEEMKPQLQSLVPVWNPVSFGTSNRIMLPDSTKLVVAGGTQRQLEWIRSSYPESQLLELASGSSIETIAHKLSSCSFDQLLWIAPDVSYDADQQDKSNDLIIEQQEQGVLALFRIIKALLDSGHANKKLQVTIITSRTQRVAKNDRLQPAHAGVIGLVGSLAKECPHWSLRLLDLESLSSVSAQECLSVPWDKQGNGFAHRQGEWFEQALAPMSLSHGTPVFRQNGVYVVIGGAGGVGEVWSRFMMERYQANIVWIGRREYNTEIENKINSLVRLGNAVLYISADATNLDDLQQACKTILKTYPAIHGVVHSAIVLHDQSIARMDESAFRASLSAKVNISVNMDRVFGNQKLDFMLFFSSIISFFKTPGQSNYAAGSTFKDSFAQNLQQERPYPVKIMNWGYWGNTGVAADEFHRKLMAQMGMGSIEPQEGMASVEALVSSEISQLALIKTLYSQPAAGLSLSAVLTSYQQSMMKSVVPQSAGLKTGSGAAIKTNRSTNGSPRSADLSEQMGSSYIQQIITANLSNSLRLEASRIRNDAPFADYGVDSIVGVNLVHTINETLEIELEATKLFEYSTVDQLTEYIWMHWKEQIAAKLVPAQSISPKPVDVVHEITTEPRFAVEHRFIKRDPGIETDTSTPDGEGNAAGISTDPIAVIGMSGRFAESESLEEFWQNLKDGKDLVKQASRWSTKDCVIPGSADHAYCSYGSFIDSIDQFDPVFFRISPLEALYMDPQQRLFLEECWKALEDAGYAGKSVHEKQCGIYVGCGTSNYDHLFMGEVPPQAWWGNSQSVAPARIAYYLNLQGPAIAVDTACSSSLVAIHLACQGLWSGEMEMAIAGGVYVEATPAFHQVANRAGMLSSEGKCYSFDARANGFVPGEGVGVVVLKRLQDALRDGDYTYGVIAGSGINQNGSSNGLIAPNARAQERLERTIYERFNINPETIQFVEAHGTGTLLGDSIEYGAISRAFREYTDKKQFCAIGSVKSNIGHAATAAGVASVLKVLLSLKHRQIPPSLHFQKGNPAIDFASSPFYVNTQLKEWELQGAEVRRAAINSFSFSGTNAHVIIEDAPSLERTDVDLPGYLVVLSARTSEQLRQQAQNLLAFIRRTAGLSMNDLSFSLFVGRMHFTHRLSCIVRNQEELVYLFEQWLETGAANHIGTSEIQEGKIREQTSLKKFGNYCIQECRNATDSSIYIENLEAIAELYRQGYLLDYHVLFTSGSRRIPLPAYPFAREHFWIEAKNTAGSRLSSAAATAALHPLLHENTSNFIQVSYRSTFTDTELYLKDHQLVIQGQVGQNVFPAAAYLEMAQAALRKSVSIPQTYSAVALEGIVWGPPMVIGGSKEVTVALLADDEEQINYEIYSEAEQQTVYCQGRACFTSQSAPPPINISELQEQMLRSTLDADSIYAEFTRKGVLLGPAYQTITAIYKGDKQLLARVSLPSALVSDEARPGQEDYFLHPILITGALQAGIRLIADSEQSSGLSLLPRILERLCVLSPCTAEMFAWARYSRASLPKEKQIKLDLDLMDPNGRVCVQMRGLVFQMETAVIEPAVQVTWLFSTAGGVPHNGSIGTAEKMELFLRQEAALQLQKPLEKVPIDQSYFDLGLTSLGIAHLVQKTNHLLNENLPPSALFEYRDIQTLAAYLAKTYSSKVAAVTATKEKVKADGPMERTQINVPELTPLPRRRFSLAKPRTSSYEEESTTAVNNISGDQVLEKILWQQSSLDDTYEKVTF